MILNFTKTFPNGIKTYFDQKILETKEYFKEELTPEYLEYWSQKLQNSKWHTLRLSSRYKGHLLHLSTGSRTKHYNCFLHTPCRGVQQIHMKYSEGMIEMWVDGREMDGTTVNRIIKNDGLTKKEFINWFFSADDEFNGYIIHFSNLKY